MSKKTRKNSKSAPTHSPSIKNKRARFDYHLIEKLEAGIELKGTEVKSLRNAKASLAEAFCRVRGAQLYLLNCNIAQYPHANLANHEPLRPRKLLVHRRELAKIEVKLNQKGLTLIPVKIYFTRGLAKVEIALAEGKTRFDKRQKLKDQQAQRDMGRYQR